MANPVLMMKLIGVASLGASNMMMPSYRPKVKLLDGDVFGRFDFFKVFNSVFGFSFRHQKCDK